MSLPSKMTCWEVSTGELHQRVLAYLCRILMDFFSANQRNFPPCLPFVLCHVPPTHCHLLQHSSYISDKHRISREYSVASLKEMAWMILNRRRTATDMLSDVVSWDDKVWYSVCIPFKHFKPHRLVTVHCPSRMLLLSIKGLSRASSFERRRSCHEDSAPTNALKSFDEPCRLMCHK